MRILVTGANGLVGSRTAALLGREGHEVVGTGRGTRRCEGDFGYAPCELSHPDELAALLAQARPERILHCGAVSSVDHCQKSPAEAIAVNVTATAILAEHARSAGAHLVYVSTDYVFDGAAGPYAEDAIPNPLGAYALTKHMGEQAVRAVGGSWSIARTAIVYGWPAAGRLNFGAWLVEALRSGRKVPLFIDQVITPSLAANVAAMLAEITVQAHPGLWHCAGPDAVSRLAFGERLCDVFGFSRDLISPTPMAQVGLPGPRPRRCGLRVDKVTSALKTRPLSLDASLHVFRDEVRAG